MAASSELPPTYSNDFKCSLPVIMKVVPIITSVNFMISIMIIIINTTHFHCISSLTMSLGTIISIVSVWNALALSLSLCFSLCKTVGMPRTKQICCVLNWWFFQILLLRGPSMFGPYELAETIYCMNIKWHQHFFALDAPRMCYWMQQHLQQLMPSSKFTTNLVFRVTVIDMYFLHTTI